jgi:hypothetical protein
MYDMHCSQSSLSHDKPAQNVIIQSGFGVTLEAEQTPLSDEFAGKRRRTVKSHNRQRLFAASRRTRVYPVFRQKLKEARRERSIGPLLSKFQNPCTDE